MAKLLIDYADENDIVLNINKQSKKKNYPLDWAVHHNNIEMVKLLMKYADDNNILLDINQKSENGIYPLITAIGKNKNIEMVKLLMKYVNRKNNLLDINQKFDDGSYTFLFTISIDDNVKDDTIKLLLDYEKEYLINIEYKNDGKFITIKELSGYESLENININHPLFPNFSQQIPQQVPQQVPQNQYQMPFPMYYYLHYQYPPYNYMPMMMPSNLYRRRTRSQVYPFNPYGIQQGIQVCPYMQQNNQYNLNIPYTQQQGVQHGISSNTQPQGANSMMEYDNEQNSPTSNDPQLAEKFNQNSENQKY
eukprot:jgi/Orpsp1_1/1191959/evm.model.d7180000089625.1